MPVPTWMCGLEQISSLLCGPQFQYRGAKLCTCKGPCLPSIPWFSWQSVRNPILSLGLFRGSLAKTSELSLEQRHTETWDLREGTSVVSSQTQKWEFSQDTNRPVPSISRVSGFSIPPTSLSQKNEARGFFPWVPVVPEQGQPQGCKETWALPSESNMSNWVFPPLVSWSELGYHWTEILVWFMLSRGQLQTCNLCQNSSMLVL